MTNLDIQFFTYINNLPHSLVADFVFLLIHNLTREGLIYFILAVCLLLQKQRLYMTLVTLGTISGFVTYVFNDLLLKNIFQRVRPFEALTDLNFVFPVPDSFSMPSGQAAVAAALLAMVIFTVPNKKFQIGFGIFALLVMFDRVYLGHHYPSDVVIGALVGAVVSFLIFKSQNLIFAFGKSLRFNK